MKVLLLEAAAITISVVRRINITTCRNYLLRIWQIVFYWISLSSAVLSGRHPRNSWSSYRFRDDYQCQLRAGQNVRTVAGKCVLLPRGEIWKNNLGRYSPQSRRQESCFYFTRALWRQRHRRHRWCCSRAARYRTGNVKRRLHALLWDLLCAILHPPRLRSVHSTHGPALPWLSHGCWQFARTYALLIHQTSSAGVLLQWRDELGVNTSLHVAENWFYVLRYGNRGRDRPHLLRYEYRNEDCVHGSYWQTFSQYLSSLFSKHWLPSAVAHFMLYRTWSSVRNVFRYFSIQLCYFAWSDHLQRGFGVDHDTRGFYSGKPSRCHFHSKKAEIRAHLG